MKDPYPIDAHGTAHVPPKPGVGVELDWDEIDRTCVEHKISKAVEGSLT
jgi:L-alanine-DL-glutamate epimerase-like enolase superfamily enzyme